MLILKQTSNRSRHEEPTDAKRGRFATALRSRNPIRGSCVA